MLRRLVDFPAEVLQIKVRLSIVLVKILGKTESLVNRVLNRLDSEAYMNITCYNSPYIPFPTPDAPAWSPGHVISAFFASLFARNNVYIDWCRLALTKQL